MIIANQTFTAPVDNQPTTQPVYRVGIFGATGYAGQIAVNLLSHHPNARIAFVTSERAADPGNGDHESLGAIPIYPAADAPLDTIDAAFLCLPNGVSGAVAARAIAAGVRVIDLSADLRLDSAELYKSWYKQDNPAPQLLPAPYGLPEIAGKRAALAGARYVANPGCHVTATLLALYPLAAAHALTADPVIADTKTGVSGAGKTPKLDSMFVEVYGDVKPYNIGHIHRHVPEIEQELHNLQADVGPLIFAPHLIPIDVGLLATVYARLRPGWTLERARELFIEAYQHEPLVDLLPAGQVARIADVAHTNRAVIGLSAGVSSATGDTIIITSAIDNLRKGASSQAVQNFNIMFGLPETTGLL